MVGSCVLVGGGPGVSEGSRKGKREGLGFLQDGGVGRRERRRGRG